MSIRKAIVFGPCMRTLAVCCVLHSPLVAAAQISRDTQPDPSASQREGSAGARLAKPDGAGLPPGKSLPGSLRLPWAGKEQESQPAGEVAGPHELLGLFGIDQSQLDMLFDGRPLGPDDDDTLVRILYRLPQFQLRDIDRWQRTGVKWDEVIADPGRYRAELFRLDGQVTRIVKEPLLKEVAELFDFDHYYRVEMQLQSQPCPVLVCTRELPEAWSVGRQVKERARAIGLFLKVGDTRGPHPQLVFAAQRVAWLPDHVEGARGIRTGHVLLAEAGVDVGLFDAVRKSNGQPLEGGDRECFYQTLAAAGKLADRLAAGPAVPLDLTRVLQEPGPLQGELMTLEGTARRVTRVIVNDPDIRDRFAIDHYFQLDVFVPLGDKLDSIQLGKTSGDKAAPVFTNAFPVTVCVRALPERLAELARDVAAGNAQYETLNQRIRLRCFFFKVWSYSTQYVSKIDERQRQPSPLLIGNTPELVETQAARNPWWGVTCGAAFVLALLAVWLGMWRYGQSDEAFRQKVFDKQFEPPTGKSLDDLGIEGQDGPDFSNLAT